MSRCQPGLHSGRRPEPATWLPARAGSWPREAEANVIIGIVIVSFGSGYPRVCLSCKLFLVEMSIKKVNHVPADQLASGLRVRRVPIVKGMKSAAENFNALVASHRNTVLAQRIQHVLPLLRRHRITFASDQKER